MHPSVNMSSSGAASRAEIKPGVLLLCLEDVQSQRAVLHFPTCAEAIYCHIEGHTNDFQFTFCDRQQRQQLIGAHNVPGELHARRHVTGQRDVLSRLDYKGRAENRFFLQLQCFLIGSLVDSFSLSSATSPLSVTFKVGNQAVLPCSWKQRLGEVAPSTCYIQWTSPADTVFELQGEKKWQADEFQGRMEVTEEKLKSGDCSLVISDVQIGDTGRYESFMLVDGVRSAKTKVFIQSVKLSVSDYKSILFRGPGEDLVLDLYTQHSVKVVFQGR
ncbi:hypothetical protein JOQ06_015765 [Pogonophryne albipinna]|uniref:Immunoglobulin V-set domain-containing protein n=1 Tax=Pogonophryne albipinna TaxID=1090488 RepID=A0AAD6AM17_9TELE|nr:hypothetical protein JOQ06_015765 [Pogonophryne albipinna]